MCWPAKVAAIDVDALLSRYGRSLRQPAAEFGIPSTTVSDLLRDAGVETNRFAVPQDTVDQIIRMYADGGSCITIGKHVGRGKSTVHEIVVRNRIRLRDPHGRER